MMLGKIRIVSLIICLIALITAPFLITCSKDASKPLKIGLLCNLQNSMGLDTKKGVEVAIHMINKKGGLEVSGEKYQLQLICYDSQNIQATTLAAANRLIFEDNVKFIIHDPQLVETYLPIAEKNKVITNGGTASQATVKPGLKYSCMTAGANFSFPLMLAWYVKNHRDKTKCYVMVAPDDQNGHFSIDVFMAPIMESLGVKVKKVFYPANQTDLSAVATKILSLNPTTVDCVGGGPVQDIMAAKAVWNAGYRGQFFTGGGVDVACATQYLPPEQMEHILCSGRAIDYDPPSTQIAKDIKAAWIDLHGKYEGESVAVDEFLGLIAAIQQAGTIDDTDKIIKVIYSGMKFQGQNGQSLMVARPDLGDPINTRDSIESILVRTFTKDYKPIPIETIDPEKGLELTKMIPQYKNTSQSRK